MNSINGLNNKKQSIKSWKNLLLFIVSLALVNLIYNIASEFIISYLGSSGIIRWYFSVGGQIGYYFIINLISGALLGVLNGIALAVILKRIKKKIMVSEIISIITCSVMLGYMINRIISLGIIIIQFSFGIGIYFSLKRMKIEITDGQSIFILFAPILSYGLIRILFMVIYSKLLPNLTNRIVPLNLIGTAINGLVSGALTGAIVGYAILFILEEQVE